MSASLDTSAISSSLGVAGTTSISLVRRLQAAEDGSIGSTEVMGSYCRTELARNLSALPSGLLVQLVSKLFILTS